MRYEIENIPFSVFQRKSSTMITRLKISQGRALPSVIEVMNKSN